MGDTLNLMLAIDFCVHAEAFAVFREDTAGITKIDAAHQFTHDDKVGSPHAVGLQR